MNSEYTQKQTVVNNKKTMASRLNKRKNKIEELLKRNKKTKGHETTPIIMNPMVVNLKDGTKRVSVGADSG